MYHFGVKVCIVEPGFFKTAVTNLESIEASLRQLWDRLAPETRLSYGEDFFHKCECLSFPTPPHLRAACPCLTPPRRLPQTSRCSGSS